MTPEQKARAKAYIDQANAVPLPPGHVLDQIRASARDAHQQAKHLGQILAALDPAEAWQSHFAKEGEEARPLPDEVTTLLVVALGGLSQCVHLRRGGPQPAWARLALHRLDCVKCLATLRYPPADEADACDWCHSRANTAFRPYVVQSGPVLAYGDACGACDGTLRLLEREGAQ